MITQMQPIADLHCDLLSHLIRDPSNTPFDKEVRCSIPQMAAGGVKLQVMAIFTETVPDSSQLGLKQIKAYKDLLNTYSTYFTPLQSTSQLGAIYPSAPVAIIPAIENASSLCNEIESLDGALKRATANQRSIGKFCYAGLTWNMENRFGGGASTSVGLKSDGEKLLDYLAEHHIAIDFSHTSDPLAYDILNYLDKKSLSPPLLASHSNMRAIANHRRNLPDELAKELIKRNGLIGINFVKHFVGETSPLFFAKQLTHMISLGGKKNVCFGADFFNELDLPVAFRREGGSFFPDFGDASSYPALLTLLKEHTSIDPNTLSNLAWKNLMEYLDKSYFTTIA